MKKKRKKIINKDIFGFLPLFIFLILTSTTFVYTANSFVKSGFFAIKNIEVDGIEYLKEDEIKKIAKIDYGTNLLSVNLKFISEQIKKNRWVYDVKVTRKIPDSIKIKIKERKPFALVKIKGVYFIVDERGEPFKMEDEKVSSLTVIENIPVSDIKFNDKDGTIEIKKSKYYKAVLDVLKISQKKDSVIQKNSIKKIFINKDIEMKLIVSDNKRFNKIKEITLGYTDYMKKMKSLDILYNVLKKNEFSQIKKIDLNHSQGIVVE